MKLKRKIIFFFTFFQVLEHRWNEIDRVKPKYWRENLSQYHFVYHKSYIEPGSNPVLCYGRPATNLLSHGTA
jgi:hypothetical protein